MRKLLINNKKFIPIIIAIVIVVFGFGGYKVSNYLQASNLVIQAKELKTNESYKEAIESLKKAQGRDLTEGLKEEISKELKENKQLILDKSNYYQGVERADNGDWQGAMDLWTKIPDLSVYSKKVRTEERIPVVKPSGEQVHLINYNHAKDPTWKELIAFLKKDGTDDNLYKKDSFECTNFAEMLHNNAEKAGIKAAYVTVNFAEPPGHALNAFNTTDKGLVYIDDTGKGFSEMRNNFLSRKCEWDKVAYLVKGEKIGAISINFPSISPRYQFYEDYSKLWADAEAKSEKYAEEINNYNQKLRLHKNKVNEYNKKVKAYNKEFDKFNKKIKEEEIKIDQEYGYNELKNGFNELNDKKKNLNAEYDRREITWEDYNWKWDKLEEEQKMLEEKRRELMNKIQQINENLKTQKVILDNKRFALERQSKDLNYERSVLSSIAKQLNSELYVMKQQEKNLNTCYWKPLPRVTKIKVYW